MLRAFEKRPYFLGKDELRIGHLHALFFFLAQGSVPSFFFFFLLHPVKYDS